MQQCKHLAGFTISFLSVLNYCHSLSCKSMSKGIYASSWETLTTLQDFRLLDYIRVLLDFSLTVKAATTYSYLSVVRLFPLLRKGNQVLFIIW